VSATTVGGPRDWHERLLGLVRDLAGHAGDEPYAAALAIMATARELCALCGELLAPTETRSPQAPGAPPDPLAGVAAGPPTALAPASLVAHLLGPFRLYLDAEPVADWNGHKSRGVIAYLLANRRKRVPKEILLELLWPDAEPDAARRNLHQAVYSVRSTLRRRRADVELVRFEDGCYELSPEGQVWVDVEEFEERVASGRRLDAMGHADAAAVEYGTADVLYGGDFLEDRPYDDWTNPRRDQLRSLHRHAAGRLCGHYAESGELSAAIAVCQKVLALDRCDEQAHRRLMRLYAAQGQRHLAVHQFEACSSALREDLGLLPSEDTRALCRELTARFRPAGRGGRRSMPGVPSHDRRLSPR
jgi:DNA-binding SARP family transcriptional activator